MIPKDEHINQIERFHAKMDEISKTIDKHKEDDSRKELIYELSIQYYNMTKLWGKIDDFIENTLKKELDSLEED